MQSRYCSRRKNFFTTQADVLVNTPVADSKEFAKAGAVAKAFKAAGGDELEKVRSFLDTFNICVTLELCIANIPIVHLCRNIWMPAVEAATL